MKKGVVFVALSLVLVAGCSQNSEKKELRDSYADVNQYYNARVLNCVMPIGQQVFEERTVCPVGQESFAALRLGPHFTYGMHLDWEPISYMRFPVPLPVCLSNGFVIAENKYSADKIARLKRVVESQEYQNHYRQQHATYFLYAKMLEFSGEKLPDQWRLYLKASWEADNCNHKIRYREYALSVIAEATERLTDLSGDDEEYWILRIIIPNLYRRIGEFDKAAEQLKKVGFPMLVDQQLNEHFMLAKEILTTEISRRNTVRIAIKKS